MYRCDICNKNLINQNARDGHFGSAKHARKKARHSEQADSTTQEATQFHCCDCDRDFVHGQALMQHLRDKIHKPKQKSATSKKFACDICGEVFATQKAVNSHKASQVHNPLCETFPCLASQECGKTFASASAQLLHLENGACISGLTRHKINELIVSQDINRLISSQRAIDALKSPDDSWSMLTPSSSRFSALDEVESWDFVSTGPGTSLAGIDTCNDSTVASITDMHSNGSHQNHGKILFLCHLCPMNSNHFKTAQDLEKHSKSAAHAPKLFHCPTALLVSQKRTHLKHFSTLSGLVMHVESGACSEGKKAVKILLNVVNDRLNELGFRQISLLE